MFTFIYYNSFPTSPLSVAKESTAVEKCVRQPWNLREAPHISMFISLLIHLIVDVKKCVSHFFVRTYPLYMRPQIISTWCIQSPASTLGETPKPASQPERGPACSSTQQFHCICQTNLRFSQLSCILFSMMDKDLPDKEEYVI